MADRKRLREMGVPEDMTADDVKAFFDLPDDDLMHQQTSTAERDDILQKMQVLRIHARGASKTEKVRLDRDYKALHTQLQDLGATPPRS